MFFRSEESARDWCESSGIPFGHAMPIVTAWKLGAVWYRDRLDADWRPKTAERMRSLFAEVGLAGPFWDVP